MFFYDFAKDISYDEIDGQWLNDKPYGVVHRIACPTDAVGVGQFCLEFAFNDCKNLRIDTHKDNKPMINLLEKLGFKYCGIIKIATGDTRLAFHKVI